ncbi:hypothetical protein BH10PSE13_BH10PSE13_20240 [soil metagenome]
MAFGSMLLAFDGVFGLRVFPRFLSLARRAEEESIPEQMLYSAALGGFRYAIVIGATLILAVAKTFAGKADWLMWLMIATPIGYFALLIVHATKAIDRAGRFLSEKDAANSHKSTMSP